MSETTIFVIAGALLLVVAVSGRLSRAWLTEPLAIVAIGAVVAAVGFGPIDMGHPGVLSFLEVTLALVLFTDAARIDVRKRGRVISWPARMLGIGLPLAMVLGALFAAWILGLPFGVAVLLGVILAPTDAALAEPVLEAEELPVRVRQSINVESGLNDGLALPALFIAIAIIEAEEGQGIADALLLVVRQLGIGVAGGIVTGFLGAWLIKEATTRGWMNRLHQQIAALAMALACFAAVQLLGGSGFVATFVAGAVLGSRLERSQSEYLFEFAETGGKMLVLVAFFFIGGGPVYLLLSQGAGVEVWLLALASLFIVRPVAIAISLMRGRLLLSTTVFLGWFGPRGLATLVFFLVAVEELGTVRAVALDAVVATVTLSILLHGVSARPASMALARRIERAELEDEDMAEMAEVYDHPMRSSRESGD